MANSKVEPTIMHIFEKVVFINELLRDIAELDVEILRVVQWSLWIEVADIKGDTFGDLSREETVDDMFENIKRCSLGSHVSWVFDTVSANRNVNTIGIFIFGTEHAHDLGACDLFSEIHGYVVVVYDIEVVSEFGALGGFVGAGPYDLSETSEFICIGSVTCWY